MVFVGHAALKCTDIFSLNIERIPVLMIRSLYLDFGFFTTLIICLGIVVFFIIWLAGIAGLLANPDTKKEVGWVKIICCILIPVYPFLWLIFDTFKEYITIRKHTVNTQRN